jgi:hypothetical protein
MHTHIPCRRRSIAPFASVLAGAACALMLAACGGAGVGVSAAGTSNGANNEAGLTFAKCMRAHSVSGFPDPGGAATSGVSILGISIPPTMNIHAPAFQAALNQCMKAFNAGHPRPPITASQKAAAVKFSECMRAHGVPNYPDPVFPPGGGIEIGPRPGSNVNMSAPEVVQAQKVCGDP